MNASQLTDSEIRALGWQALVDRLGPSGALRFALQTERGYGDYAERRHRQLGHLSVDDLLARMGEMGGRRGARSARRSRNSRPRAKDRRER